MMRMFGVFWFVFMVFVVILLVKSMDSHDDLDVGHQYQVIVQVVMVESEMTQSVVSARIVPQAEIDDGFRPVLSVFGRPGDHLAGGLLRWPVPPLGEDGEPMDVPVEEFVRRKVSPRDTCVAMRYKRKYAGVRVCQAGRCADTYVCDTGPWGARCSSPDHCAPGRPCKRRTSDPTRPGNTDVWWWTVQVERHGPCVHRGVVDVPDGFCELINCRSMKPVTVRMLGRMNPGSP